MLQTAASLVLALLAIRGVVAISDDTKPPRRDVPAITITLPPGFADPVIDDPQTEFRV